MAAFARMIGLAVLAVAAVGDPAVAQDNGPVIVIPGRRDVPVFINGREASYAVVESDWGLYRAGWIAPTVIKPLGSRGPAVRGHGFEHYYPVTGQKPGYGRLEYDPGQNRKEKPAQPWHESWSASSQNLPATIMPPDYSYDMPGGDAGPYGRGRWRGGGGGGRW
jgi:hypothetical protein